MASKPTDCFPSARPCVSPCISEEKPDAHAGLRQGLRRCSPQTIEAAIAYQATGDVRHIPLVVTGIFERFVDPEVRPRLAGACDELRIVDDLGLDSLTMMEVVMLVEEVLDTQIENEALRGLATIGDVKLFVAERVKGRPAPESLRSVAA